MSHCTTSVFTGIQRFILCYYINTLYNHNFITSLLGRDLHKFLGIKEKYTEWFNRYVEYGFVEGADYNLLENQKAISGALRRIDHQMIISMAKEFSMLQKNKKGKEARLYFIKKEVAFNKLAKDNKGQFKDVVYVKLKS